MKIFQQSLFPTKDFDSIYNHIVIKNAVLLTYVSFTYFCVLSNVYFVLIQDFTAEQHSRV